MVFALSCNVQEDDSKLSSFDFSRRIDSLIQNPIKVSPVVDSLKREIKKTDSVTRAVDILNEMATAYHNPPVCIKWLAEEALRLSEKHTYDAGKALAYTRRGFYYYWTENFDSALFFYQKSLDLATKKKFKKELCDVHIHIGLVLTFQNEIDSAVIEYNNALKLARESKNEKQEMTVTCFLGEIKLFTGEIETSKKLLQKGLRLARKLKNRSKESFCLLKLGDLERLRNNYPEALKLLNATVRVSEKNADHGRVAFCLSSMGDIYSMMDDTTKAIELLNKSVEYSIRSGDRYLLAGNYTRLGEMHSHGKRYERAAFYFKKGLECSEGQTNSITGLYCRHGLAEIYRHKGNQDTALNLLLSVEREALVLHDYNLLCTAMRSRCAVYEAQGKTNQAIETGLNAYRVAEKSQVPYNVQRVSWHLYNLYSKQKNYALALAYYETFIRHRDSMSSERAIRKFAAVEYEVKEQKLIAEQARKEAKLNAEKKVKDKEIENQRIVNVLLISGAGLMVLLLLVSLRAYRIKKKANQVVELQKAEVERQKTIIEDKQKEIVDSINYAKRIQFTLLAHDEILKQNLNEHFIYFRPKDIVSGDFYWCTKKENDFYLAICDCTGHGVPGAFMSLLNITLLNEAINEKNISNPGNVLDFVRERIIKTMEGNKDGMDAVLLKFSGNKLYYAAAHNCPVLIRDGILSELPSDKMPVGSGDMTQSFTTYEHELKKSDSLYVYTDGFADQFGGPKGKKFKYSNLKKVLIENNHAGLSSMNSKLNSVFE
ncbi:MAG: tetratricopeptide repeat protein, partial [Flavobacteriales bacterium]